MTCHSERIEMLTERAKHLNDYTDDLDIGESAYLLGLIGVITEYRSGFIPKDKLAYHQKTLLQKLESYYQHCEIFDLHIQIRNKYSPVMTEAEKHGCQICKRLVKIFDGREHSISN